jgi:4'-phosphopantetheinyl transferase
VGLSIPNIPNSNDIQIWYIDFSTAPIASLADLDSLYHAILQPDEIAYGKSCYPQRRIEFTASRCALRLLLTRYFPNIRPLEWRFSLNKYGKPSVSGPISIAPLQFNVSHTHGMAAIAFGFVDALGIDIEVNSRSIDLVEIAESSFSPSEILTMNQTSGVDLQRRFFEYWTLKESFIKAIGHGLSLPLDQFSFSISANFQDQERSIGIKIEDSIGWARGGWTFTLLNPQTEIQIALAARSLVPSNIRFVEAGYFTDWYAPQPLSQLNCI